MTENISWKIIRVYVFLHTDIFALKKPVLVFIFFAFSYWSQLVYGRGRVETHFYLSGIGGRFAPVTAAVGHEHSSLRSSSDGHQAPMTFSDTFYHAAHKKSIGVLIIETRFYPPHKNLGTPWSLRSSHGRGSP